MNVIKIEGISDSYPEPIEGTFEWFYCRESNDNFCDLYETEEIVKSGQKYSGSVCHLIHYPEGKVYSPFKQKENVYIERPVWDKGAFYFLKVDFSVLKMQIYSYFPNSQRLEIVKELPLELVEDCYNLMLKVSPLMLTRAGKNKSYEIIWPENKIIEIGDTETLLFRDGKDLYFTAWWEDPKYHESIIVRDVNTGEVKESYPGYLCRMPNGVYWRIQ